MFCSVIRNGGRSGCRRFVFAVLLAALLAGGGPLRLLGATKNLQKLSEAELIEDPDNDGDSFRIQAGGKEVRVRLYFVDCPEKTAGSLGAPERIEEQANYFGVTAPARMVWHGAKAAAFVKQRLSRPFTVHTAWAQAPGSSSPGRIYGFVTTADGKDLGSLLVELGLARSKGVGRQLPDGTSSDDFRMTLGDLKESAMLKRSGIWADSDADRITEVRAEQRAKKEKWNELKKEADRIQTPPRLIDINAASKRELETISGIGPVLADRIIRSRPFTSVDDLIRIKGIGPVTLKKIRSLVTVGKTKE